MYDWHVLPPYRLSLTSFPVCNEWRLLFCQADDIPQEEVVEVDEHRRVVEDDRQGYPVEGVAIDGDVHLIALIVGVEPALSA